MSSSCDNQNSGSGFDDYPVAIKGLFIELEQVEIEARTIFNSIQIIAKDLYVLKESFYDNKKKQINMWDFYNSIKNISQEYSPTSLFGYSLNVFSESGIALCEMTKIYLNDIDEKIIEPIHDNLRTYSNLTKLRKKINSMYSELESVKNKIKSDAGKLQTNKQGVHPITELYTLGSKFQEYQQHAITAFKCYISKQKETINNLSELIESKITYHSCCLEEINNNLTAFNHRLAGQYRQKIFGISLKDHLIHCNVQIAVILHDCVAWVMNYGLDEQGIFRLPGNKVKVNKLVSAYDAGITIPRDFIPSVHVICAVLKQYLRDLPESLLFKECSAESVKEILRMKKENQTEFLQNIINKLPKEYYNNVNYFFKFLSIVEQHKESNLMNAQNLGVVFGPSIINGVKGFEQDLVDLSMGSSSLVENIILNYDFYFPNNCVLQTDDYIRIAGDKSLSNSTENNIQIVTLFDEKSYETSRLTNEDENNDNHLDPPYHFTNLKAICLFRK